MQDLWNIARKAYQHSIVITNRTMREYLGLGDDVDLCDHLSRHPQEAEKKWLDSTYSRADAWILPEIGFGLESDWDHKASLQIHAEMEAVFTFLGRILTGQTADASPDATANNEIPNRTIKGVHSNLTDIVFDDRQDVEAERSYRPINHPGVLDSIATLADVIDNLEIHILATRGMSDRFYLKDLPARRISLYSRLTFAPSFQYAKRPKAGISFRWFCDVPQGGNEWFSSVFGDNGSRGDIVSRYAACFEQNRLQDRLVPGSDLTIYVSTSSLTGEMLGCLKSVEASAGESLAQRGVNFSVMPPRGFTETLKPMQ